MTNFTMTDAVAFSAMVAAGDPAAMDALMSLSEKDRSFLADLDDKRQRYGLSEKQVFWFVKIASRACDKEVVEPRPEAGFECPNILGFMTRAREAGLKYPKVKMTAGGQPLVLSLAGEKSKTPGAVNITDGGPFDDNVWYGRINVDGTVNPSRSWTGDVAKVLAALERDPARTMAAYGQRTGTCCMCRRHLEDYRSVSVGYGPICADKYGLPWGEVEGNPSEYTEDLDTADYRGDHEILAHAS